eukprot:1407707-Amphidinium_carterae.2
MRVIRASPGNPRTNTPPERQAPKESHYTRDRRAGEEKSFQPNPRRANITPDKGVKVSQTTRAKRSQT